MDLPLEVTPAEVKRRLDAGEPVYLVDVRPAVKEAQGGPNRW